jgi:lactate racemase
MRLELAYGSGRVSGELPEPVAVCESHGHRGDSATPESAIVARAVDGPLGTPPLRDMARGARRVVILISGKDRVAGAQVYVPVLRERLAEAGLPDDGMHIVCATGTHARHTPADVRTLVGDEVAARVRFRAHDCDETDAFVDLGPTPLGTPVKVARDVVEADLRILTGRIAHHYFAGFSGGRKSILPGVSARETIIANHRRVLDFEQGCRVHPQVFGGNLVGNPVHEDMLAAARKLGPTFVLDTLVDERQRLTHAFAGELDEAHLRGCEAADRLSFQELDGRVELLVATSGGWPYDINFIQAVKTLFNHSEAVAPGGVFVLVAEAAGGILKGMQQWMGHADRSSLGAAIEASYNLAAHNSLMLQDLLARMTVVLVSALPVAEVRSVGLVPAATLPEALAYARGIVGAGARVRIVHDGNVTQSGFRRGAIRAAGGLARAS